MQSKVSYKKIIIKVSGPINSKKIYFYQVLIVKKQNSCLGRKEKIQTET